MAPILNIVSSAFEIAQPVKLGELRCNTVICFTSKTNVNGKVCQTIKYFLTF